MRKALEVGYGVAGGGRGSDEGMDELALAEDGSGGRGGGKGELEGAT